MNSIRDIIRSLAGQLGLAVVLLSPLAAHAAELTLSSPEDYQVIQRSSKDEGSVGIAGTLVEGDATSAVVEARIAAGGKRGGWRRLSANFTGPRFEAVMAAPSGGWYGLEVRALNGDKVLAEAAVEHVGVGEVFVVAGQSNAANHGAEKQTPKTGLVTTFDGKRWRLSADPQPGASGNSGSFLPPFGDAIAERFKVPVGLIACGVGATSVREWLPQGARFPNPPTLVDRVRQLPNGEWESKGELFAMFSARMKQLGPRGFRAVLWHQGESDANQQDPTRTLPGKLYRLYLEQLIRDSRREIGWDAPWFVAQVSYHVPGDEASPDIRAAQRSLWTDGIANEGPDTDLLKGEYRESNGQGVHFSGQGLREHAARWAEKVVPWIEQNLR
jgi:hypothetical protein